jgi:hypothetical protein
MRDAARALGITMFAIRGTLLKATRDAQLFSRCDPFADIDVVIMPEQQRPRALAEVLYTIGFNRVPGTFNGHSYFVLPLLEANIEFLRPVNTSKKDHYVK